jgi:hypothetical protein
VSVAFSFCLVTAFRPSFRGCCSRRFNLHDRVLKVGYFDICGSTFPFRWYSCLRCLISGPLSLLGWLFSAEILVKR